jgi:phosphate-selective porin
MIRRFVVALAIGCSFAAGGWAADEQPASVEERLQRLEEGFEQLRQMNETLRAENAKLRDELDLVASAEKQPKETPAATEPRIEIGGLLQVQGEAGDTVDGTFSDDNDRVYVRRARLGVSGSLSKDFGFDVEGEFAGTAGSSTGLRAQLTDGFVTFTKWPAAKVRAGQFKTPFGFENLYSDSRLFVPERSVGNDLLALSRQLGVQVSGELVEKRLTYAVGAFNGTASNTSFNDNDDFLVAARLTGLVAGEPKGPMSLRLGISSYQSDDSRVTLSSDFGFDSTPATPARDNVFAGSRTGFGLDAQLAAGRSEFWAEYLTTSFEPDNAAPRGDIRASGWFAQATYFAIPDKLQLVGKFESADPSDETSANDIDVWWLGTNYYLKSHDIKLQLFYVTDDGDGSGRVVARVQTLF